MILTYLCFVPGSLSPRIVADLIESHDLGFAPERMRTDRFGRSGVRFTSQAVQRLRELDEVGSVEVAGSEGSFRLTGMGGWPAQVLATETREWPSEELIDSASALPGFVAALVGDAEDVFWQSADQINTYQLHGRAWEDLPKVHDEVFERDKIDISQNPGRQAPAPGMWLWAASKMWFGPGAFSLVERDRLLELPVGSVSSRPDGVVVVDLFDLDGQIETIRTAQQAFRDWLGYDDLETRADEFADALADPRVEFEVGTFPHGGVRRVVEWLHDGRLVPRSSARERRCVELDTAGQVLWEDTAAV